MSVGDAAIAEMQATAADHHVATPQGRLFARSWTPQTGSVGDPLLLLHDSLGCVEVWRDFPALLCAHTQRRIIAYDRLGFGRSDARSGPLSIEFIREEAALFVPYVLNHFELPRFIPFGHSVGGGMAIQCGALLADACTAVITEAAQMFAEDRTLQSIAAARQRYREPEQLAKLAKYHGEKAPWVLRAWTDTWLAPGFASWSLEDVLPRVRCPVLAIHGHEDEFASLLHPDLMRKLAAGAVHTELLAGTGHVPHREQPALIADFAARFLSSAAPRAACPG